MGTSVFVYQKAEVHEVASEIVPYTESDFRLAENMTTGFHFLRSFEVLASAQHLQ